MTPEAAQKVVNGLREAGIDFVAYLPETRMCEILPVLRAAESFTLVPVASEAEAVGIAAALMRRWLRLANRDSALLLPKSKKAAATEASTEPTSIFWKTSIGLCAMWNAPKESLSFGVEVKVNARNMLRNLAAVFAPLRESELADILDPKFA